MTTTFDDRTGRLRLTLDGLEALVGTWRSGQQADEAPAALVQVGAVVRGEFNPALEPAAAAVVAPVCRQVLRQTGPGGEATHNLWWGLDSAAVALQVSGRTVDFFAIAPQHVPAALARVVQLGPRPRLSNERVQFAAPVMPALLGDQDARRESLDVLVASAEAPWPQWAAELRLGPWRAWSLASKWGPDEDPGTTVEVLEVVDNAQGCAAVVREANGEVFVPVTPRQLWLAMVSMTAPFGVEM